MSASIVTEQHHEALSILKAIRDEVAKTIVGKENATDQMLVALLCASHVLLEDVPGVGKTIMARALSRATGCEFGRVQFTPDVLPSDVTGSSIYNQQRSTFDFQPGPVFTQILLADEINRATPRTQAALLEAMEEQQVTVDGETRPLPQPFFVIATQNPIDLEGTFPLPEAQLDRFMLRISLGYPDQDEELAILQRFERDNPLQNAVAVTDAKEILRLRTIRSEISVSEVVRSYLVDVVRSTRSHEQISLGSSPRSALALQRASQAWALIKGRSFVTPDDVKALAVPVLAHRIMLTPAARLRNVTQNEAVENVLAGVPVPVESELNQMSAPQLP